MIEYINNIKEFEKLKSNLFFLFNKYLKINENSFNNSFKIFLAFEFDFIWDKSFFESLQNFLNNIDVDRSFFYTIKPSPEKYFFKHFSKYNAIEINKYNTNDEFNEIMMRNPKDSQVDAIALNSNEIAWFSESKDWAIIGSRDLEIAIIGFTNPKVMELFLSSFDDNLDMFYSVKEQVDNLDEIIGFNKKQKISYTKLIKSFPASPSVR